jgi:hypothetical protein
MQQVLCTAIARSAWGLFSSFQAFGFLYGTMFVELIDCFVAKC